MILRLYTIGIAICIVITLFGLPFSLYGLLFSPLLAFFACIVPAMAGLLILGLPLCLLDAIFKTKFSEYGCKILGAWIELFFGKTFDMHSWNDTSRKWEEPKHRHTSSTCTDTAHLYHSDITNDSDSTSFSTTNSAQQTHIFQGDNSDQSHKSLFDNKKFEKEHTRNKQNPHRSPTCKCMICLDMMPRHFKTSRISVCEGCAAYLDYFDFNNENIGEWFYKADCAARRAGKTLKDLHSISQDNLFESWDSTILLLCRAVDLKILSVSGEQYRPENWGELSRRIKEMDGKKCAMCGTSKSVMHVHHIVPLSSGGTNHPNNLIVLCPECHQTQHKHDILSSCHKL